MKTLSYYQNLREEYACIIPETAPAYELIEALDVLIAGLQHTQAQKLPDGWDVAINYFGKPIEKQPHFLGVPVNLPEGWGISLNSDTITLRDGKGHRVAIAFLNITGGYSMYWDGKYETTLENQTYAIKWLNGKANDI